MTSPRRSTETLLAEWGERVRALPPHLAAVRDVVLARVTPVPPRPALRPSLRFPWLSLAFTGLAVLVLLIRIPALPREQSTAVPLTASNTALRAEVREEAATALEYAPTAGVRLEKMDAPIAYGTAAGRSTRSAREPSWSLLRYGFAGLLGLLALITASLTWHRSHRH